MYSAEGLQYIYLGTLLVLNVSSQSPRHGSAIVEHVSSYFYCIFAFADKYSFQTLKCLPVGVSYLADERHVALFLSQICPVGCSCRVLSDVDGWKQMTVLRH